MIYLNDINSKPFTYDDLVDFVISKGINRKRSYIFLAAVGVKSINARQLTSNFEYKPVKLPINEIGQVLKNTDQIPLVVFKH